MIPKTVSYLFATVALLAAFSLGEEGKDKEVEKKDKKDVEMYGHYTLETDPDNDELEKYLKVMGFDEKTLKSVRKEKKVLWEIKKVNETHCQIKKTRGDLKPTELTFESGKEFEAELLDGRKVKNTITVNKEEKTARRVIKMDGFEATHDVVFCEKGLNITMKAKDASASLSFKRDTTISEDISKAWDKSKDWFKKNIYNPDDKKS